MVPFLKFIIVCSLLLVSACSGNKVEVTTDDSADYQSARQLPPLKKGANESVLQESQKPVSTALNTPNPSDSDVALSLVDISNNIKRLKIEADIDGAWNYLLSDLRRSTVTVHSRNKAAAQIEVGCGAIDDGATQAASNGWTIFKKDRRVSEYCVMQLTENKGSTLISLLNRVGNEVNGNDASIVFNQILNK